MSSRDLKSIAAFAVCTEFTEPQLRWWIFNAERNGLRASGAVVRLGRRVYIDTTRFWSWVDACQERVMS